MTKRQSLIATAAVLAILLGACGNDDGVASTVPTRQPTATMTLEPTAHVEETPTASAATQPPEDTPTSVAVPTDEQLEAALLALEEMPSGWSPSPDGEMDRSAPLQRQVGAGLELRRHGWRRWNPRCLSLELDEIMTGFPFAPFSKVEVYPLADLDRSLDAFEKVFQQMAAQ